MDGRETRVRTRGGTLVVTDNHVRLERPLVRTSHEIPRPEITRVHLTSRFHKSPLILGALLLACSAAATLTAATSPSEVDVPPFLLQSAALVLGFSGGICLLSLPLTWRAVLEVASADQRIRVRTGFRKRPRLEQALTRLHDPPTTLTDLTQLAKIRVPARTARSG